MSLALSLFTTTSSFSAEELRVSTHGFGIYRWWPFTYSDTYDVKGVSVYRFKMAPGEWGAFLNYISALLPVQCIVLTGSFATINL